MSRIAVGLRVSDRTLERIRAAAGDIAVAYVPEMSRRSQLTDKVRADIAGRLKGVDIIFATAGVDPGLIRSAGQLKWLQVTSAGIDRMVRSGLVGDGFKITTVRGMTSDSIAEWVLGVMVMFAKGLHRAVRDQAAAEWGAWIVDEMVGKTCGIVGYGAIGEAVAQRARAFGMDVVATRRKAEAVSEKDGVLVLPHGRLSELLAKSDYVVVSVPLTGETREMFGAEQFAEMKDGAILINVARGAIIDQPAMIVALQQGTIAGAGLDVTTPEPLPPESPLWKMENVIITPHISADVDDYWGRTAEVFLDNLGRFLAGQELANIVSPAYEY
jgi:phosphoglycerate dehydrogenase-like enzyme